jgi:hypothetical protein
MTADACYYTCGYNIGVSITATENIVDALQDAGGGEQVTRKLFVNDLNRRVLKGLRKSMNLCPKSIDGSEIVIDHSLSATEGMPSEFLVRTDFTMKIPAEIVLLIESSFWWKRSMQRWLDGIRDDITNCIVDANRLLGRSVFMLDAGHLVITLTINCCADRDCGDCNA